MSLRRRANTRPMAWRMTLTAGIAALGVVAVGTAGIHALLKDSVASGLADFAIFGGLGSITAAMLAWELASSRYCPRCQHENHRPRHCATCGYDMQERPRYACTEGHQVLFEPGMCDCGRRVIQLRPVPVFGHAMTSIMIALTLFAALGVAALLASLVN